MVVAFDDHKNLVWYADSTALPSRCAALWGAKERSLRTSVTLTRESIALLDASLLLCFWDSIDGLSFDSSHADEEKVPVVTIASQWRHYLTSAWRLEPSRSRLLLCLRRTKEETTVPESIPCCAESLPYFHSTLSGESHFDHDNDFCCNLLFGLEHAFRDGCLLHAILPSR